MPRRIQGKGRPCEPVRLPVILALGEPEGERSEISRAVAASAPALVQSGDDSEQVRNGGSGFGTQHLGLRRLMARANEPAAQPLPPFAPSVLCARQGFS